MPLSAWMHRGTEGDDTARQRSKPQGHAQERPTSPGRHTRASPDSSSGTETGHPGTARDGKKTTQKCAPWVVQRAKHFSWQWFTMPMATGGLANVIHNLPFRFKGLYTIGCIFFLLALAMFVVNIVMIMTRAFSFPRDIRDSLVDSNESLYIPAIFVSFGTLLINMSQYGVGYTGPWLEDTARALFWINCVLAMLTSCGIYLTLWSTQSFTVAKMTPIWIFPAYPLLLTGPHAAVLSSKLLPHRALEVIIGGVVLQGIGFMLSVMIYSAYLYRLMTHKLPMEASRPGMFVSVGPSGFTIAGLVGMASNIERALPSGYMGDGRVVALILKVLGYWVGLWLWGLALWFFLVSVFAHYSCARAGRMHFALPWFSFVFPNTALVTATFAIGKAFNVRAIEIVGATMTVTIIVVWIFVIVMMIRALVMKQVLWPSSDDEGAQKTQPDEEGGVHSEEKENPVR